MQPFSPALKHHLAANSPTFVEACETVRQSIEFAKDMEISQQHCQQRLCHRRCLTWWSRYEQHCEGTSRGSVCYLL